LPNARLVGEAEAATDTPVPERGTVWVVPAATERVPVRAAAVVGLKVTLIVQVALLFSLPPQVPVWAKLPLTVTVTVTRAPELFLTVIVCAALVVLISVGPKAGRVAGVSVTEAVAVPVSATVCGLPGALSVMVMVPVCAPPTVGTKVTLMVHEAFAASEAPQVVVSLKPALATMLEIVIAVFCELVTVIVCAALVTPTAWEAKVRLVGETATAAVPVPVRLTVCEVPPV